MKQSQRLFLTWLIEDERLFDLTKGYISPDDFTEEIFRDVAKVLYEQHAAGEINPAQIISRFTDEEQQREAAALFHARLHPVETRQEKEKALKETILRIKKNSMDVRSGKLEPTDLAGLQRLIEDKKQLAQKNSRQNFRNCLHWQKRKKICSSIRKSMTISRILP